MNIAARYLTARICLSAVFIYSGLTKLIGWSDTIAEFSALGIPLPVLAAMATIFVQLAGGLSVLTGFWITTAALGLAAFTVVATLIGHPFWTFEGVEFHRQLTTALEHLAIVGGFVLLSICTPATRPRSTSGNA